MIAYWDTSAVIALIFTEAHSASAELAKRATTQCYAWNWLAVEARCAIDRRRGNSTAYSKLALWNAEVAWLDLPVEDHPALLALNQRHRLRAADAGHLHCFQRASHVIPDLVLVSFDAELTAAARADNLHVWQPRS